MPKRTPKRSKAAAPTSSSGDRAVSFDTRKFDNVHQVGGIRTATLDHPAAGGGAGCRVAMVDTGSGLRFVVALDRGGDIVEAFFNGWSLAYLSPNDYKRPSFAYHAELDWLDSWPAGLLTTCGPRYIGAPRKEDGVEVGLHGAFSNTPAALESVVNPDPRKGRLGMSLSLVTRDCRMFAPVVEVRRRIQCTLGIPEIRIDDEVTNLGNVTVAHNWLYHVNFGYPLADAGSRVVFAGKADVWPQGDRQLSKDQLNRLKTLRDNLPEHAGTGENGMLVDPIAARDGRAHVGIANERLELAVELEYPIKDLPRLANWQHLGPRGSYVTGVEPYFGSLLGKAKDRHPLAEQWLKPGQSRRYRLTIRVHSSGPAVKDFLRHDGDVEPVWG